MKLLLVIAIFLIQFNAQAGATFNYQEVEPQEFLKLLLKVTDGPVQGRFIGETPKGKSCEVWYDVRVRSEHASYPYIDISNNAKQGTKEFVGYYRPEDRYFVAQNGAEYSFAFQRRFGSSGKDYYGWARMDISKKDPLKNEYSIKLYHDNFKTHDKPMPKNFPEESGVCTFGI
jgi:hypothetical protein